MSPAGRFREHDDHIDKRGGLFGPPLGVPNPVYPGHLYMVLMAPQLASSLGMTSLPTWTSSKQTWP